MFKTRLLSGILLVVIALITVITGGNVLFATLFLISMIGVYELYRVFEIENKAVGVKTEVSVLSEKTNGKIRSPITVE